MKRNIAIENDRIKLDGKEIQILSGAMHYFRIHPGYWRDRMIKLKQCGLNTVETYCAWNLHEPVEGEFNFSGALDLAAFIRIAQEEGLMVIVRPGPYICSEWDLGGLPAWLLTKPGIRLRCMNEPYLAAVDRYMNKVLELLAPLQITRGGPVIAMQIENEYGSYGNDHEYMEHLKEIFLRQGIDALLFTSDGASAAYLNGGTLPGVWATVNFRNHPANGLQALKKFRPNSPQMIMELWSGGANYWGRPFPEHPAEGVREDVREVFDLNCHVNFYMFHGGGNPGFMNGANSFDQYIPMLPTYDVDAPLNEEGDPTPKYFAIRDEIRKHIPAQDQGEPVRADKRAYGKIILREMITLPEALPQLATPRKVSAPQHMEHYGQSYGFILYRTRLAAPGFHTFDLEKMRDRAVIMLNQRVVTVIYRNDPGQAFTVSVPEGGAVLDILVENMGRINYGHQMEDEFRGLSGIRECGQHVFGWEVYPLPLDNIGALKFTTDAKTPAEIPAFYRGEFEVDIPCDTFLRIPHGIKGVIFLNNINLGRYWNIGPQKTLYVPAPMLCKGKNEIVVFEQQGLSEPVVESLAQRDFGPRALMQI